MTTAPPHPEDRSFSTAYRALRGTLLGFLATQIGDAQAAEDLLHDVMLKVLANEQAGCAAPDNVDGWLYTVATQPSDCRRTIATPCSVRYVPRGA